MAGRFLEARRRSAVRWVSCLAGVVGVLGLAAAGAAATGGVSWGTAIKVPGTPAIAPGGGAVAYSVSCASAGNCAAGGYYATAPGPVGHAFVVDEKNGVWGNMLEVPGTAALNSGDTSVTSVSCASAGECAAVGQYTDSSGAFQVFAADEKNGVWGDAVEMPGMGALNLGGIADVVSVSCASPGNCAAGGFYTSSSNRRHAFVVSENNSVWETAIEVPGTVPLTTQRYSDASTLSVSCSSAGDCTAGGQYDNGTTGGQAFVVDEKNGVWGTALLVRGKAAFNTGFAAQVSAVSCPSVGNCSAGGSFIPRHNTPLHGRQTAFVVIEKRGVWGKPLYVAIHAQEPWPAAVSSLSCASAGNCAAGGILGYAVSGLRAFVVTQKNGVWHAGVVVPGTPRGLNGSRNAAVSSISCASAGTCAAGGNITKGPRRIEAFLAAESPNGQWGKAIEVPGTAALTSGYVHLARVTSVSCTRARTCVAAGYYGDASADVEPFVTTP